MASGGTSVGDESVFPAFPMASGDTSVGDESVFAAFPDSLSRHDFPSYFIWGGSTASYQIDGAYAADRKSLSNWDIWTMQKPGKITGGTNGCVANNHYYRYKEDVKLMKKLGIDCYRFSISWPRILPGGRLSGGVNREGIKFYNDLIDCLIAEGITPFATIFHFEVPQCLLEEYGAFEDRRIVKDFAEYAEVCFFEFGDRVKYWVTMNEPWSYTVGGYVMGNFPPGQSSSQAQEQGLKTQPVMYRFLRSLPDQTFVQGDPGTTLYKVAHHLLLSHAEAVHIYRTKYWAVQRGKIGITNNTTWYEPYTYSPSQNPTLVNIDAAHRATDFQWGWFTAPVVTGDYPPVMRKRVGSRLPTFDAKETARIKKSFDFIGMNYYTTYLAENNPAPSPPNPTYYTDQGVTTSVKYGDGTLIGKQAASEWLYIVPRGIYELLKYNAEKYGNPNVYITENGVSEFNEPIPIAQAIRDDYRIDFYLKHFLYMKRAIKEGVNLKGFMVWSLFDNFEWSWGYSVRFGLYYVDYVNGLDRYPKNSAIWFMNFLNKNPVRPCIDREIVEEMEADVVTPAANKRTRA